MHDEAVEVLRHLDLARKARVRPHVEGEVELILLFLGARGEPVGPGLVHMHKTGRTGARAPTLGNDPTDAPLERRLHDAGPDLRVERMHGTVVLDVGDLGHRARASECGEIVHDIAIYCHFGTRPRPCPPRVFAPRARARAEASLLTATPVLPRHGALPSRPAMGPQGRRCGVPPQVP